MQAALGFDATEARPPLISTRADGDARGALWDRFADRLVMRTDLNRRLVSYQANRDQPGLRWFRYKEGFSADLVRDALRVGGGPVLDPFAGLGTAVLVAGGRHRQATGIEIMPVGARAAQAISWAGNGADLDAVKTLGAQLLRALEGPQAEADHRFPHVPITERAFPEETEQAIAKARAFLAQLENGPVLGICGEEVPVDLVLSAIAESCGFVCEEIGVLPRGKGNASQQMGRFGRRELRKCVYRWRRKGSPAHA